MAFLFKKNHLLSPLFLLIFISCEDVIQIDLEEPEPILVIDAEILWFYDSNGSNQQILLSRLTNYYNQETIKVHGAMVSITNSSGEEFVFTEKTSSGTYTCNDFRPELHENYVLRVIVDDQVYTATESMISSPPIKGIEQKADGGFLGEEMQVNIFYDDPADEKNFYLTNFNTDHLVFPELNLTDDDFFNGNELQESFSNEDLKPGQDLEIIFRGISAPFYNYMSLILESTFANPFGTPPSTIRGNIVNETDPDHFALGYFRLSKARKITYRIEE